MGFNNVCSPATFNKFYGKKQLFLKRKSHENRKMSVFSTAIFDKFNYLGFSQGDLTAGQLINR